MEREREREREKGVDKRELKIFNQFNQLNTCATTEK
jgi:hypothetical protein